MKAFEATASVLKLLAIAGGAALLVVAGTAARADDPRPRQYRFTTVLDSERDGLVATRCAAINSFGVVAVQVRDEALGVNKLITKSDDRDAPRVIVDTRQVADFPTFCDNGIGLVPSDPSINERGEVAFQGNLRRLTTRSDCGTAEQRQRRQGAFLGGGGPLTTVMHTINGPGAVISELLVADLAVNTFGQVALVPELDGTFDQGLFVARSGSVEQRFLADVPTAGFTFSGISSRVSLNELGQIAFEDFLIGPSVRGIFLSNPDGTFATIADNSGALASVSDPSLNIFGRVAFVAESFDAQGQQIFSVQTSRGGQATIVAETDPDPLAQRPVYAFFQEPSLNDLGQVAFTADILADPTGFLTTQGVFTGPDPVADKVLQVGDRIQGIRVTSVFTCSEALNNLGEIVMTVQSENPDTFEVRTLIVKAIPRS